MDEDEEEEQAVLAPVPVMDLRGLDKDELLRVSQVSCEPVIELVTPIIDKKMFNESASSGKQTFSSFYRLPETSHRITSSSGQQAIGHEGSKANGLDFEVPKASKSISQASHELETDRPKKRSKTVDLGQESAMTKYLLGMEGTWVSPRKRDKIIAAKGFPEGWKVTVSLRRKEGRCYLEFRNYVSPDGKSWPSFKEASVYLISNLAQAPLVRKLRLLGLPDNLESESVENGKKTDLAGNLQEQASEVAEPCPGVVDLESATENRNADSAGNSGDEQKQQSSTPNSNEKQNKAEGAEQKLESPSPIPNGLEEQTTTDEKVNSFVCEVCNKVFSNQSQYWGHLSKHSKLRKSANKRRATDHTSNNQNSIELVKDLSQPPGSTTPIQSKNAVAKDVSVNVDATSVPLEDSFCECRSGSLNIGWCDEGCYKCKKAVPLSELILCSWCEKEFHVSCVGIADILPGDWTCPTCKFPK